MNTDGLRVFKELAATIFSFGLGLVMLFSGFGYYLMSEHNLFLTVAVLGALLMLYGLVSDLDQRGMLAASE